MSPIGFAQCFLLNNVNIDLCLIKSVIDLGKTCNQCIPPPISYMSKVLLVFLLCNKAKYGPFLHGDTTKLIEDNKEYCSLGLARNVLRSRKPHIDDKKEYPPVGV